MANVKKISKKDLILLLINKELEMVNGPSFSTSEELIQFSKDNPEWYDQYCFTTVEQYNEFRDFFMEHFYDCFPKRISKKVVEREFSWFNLCYGLKYDFPYEQIN